MIKLIAILLPVCLTVNNFAQDISSFFSKTNTLLEQYVSDGKVDYQNIKNGNNLAELIDALAKIDYTSLEKTTQKAFLINAYNLLVIQQLTENYPTTSPMNISGFFDVKKHNIGGVMLTLNSLENDFMRPSYLDARLHFVLVCGAIGCPPIINQAYTPEKLEQQLEQQTKKALNNPNFIKVRSEKLLISEIFKWYTEDFTTDGKSVVDYINSYRDNPISKSKYDYYAYDWSINDKNEIIPNPTYQPGSTSEVGFNLQTYNAGSLLKLGKFDISVFNALYTQKKSEWMGQTFSGFRESFYSTLLQVTFGITKNARINLGADIKFATSGIVRDSDDFGGISEAFTLTNTPTSRVGVSYVGPRIKIQPFKSESNFTIQSSLLFPTTKNAEGRPNDDATPQNEALFFLDWDRIQSWTQFFYVKDFRKSQLFLEGDLWYRFGYRDEQASALDIPFTAIYSYFPTNKLTFYALASHTIRHQLNPNSFNDGITTAADFSAAGIGTKYQLSKKINLELLYTKFLRGTNSGLGNTFNIGIRYVH